MAHNERMRPIADPYLNMRNQMIAQQEMLAQRNAGLMGINYDPEDAGYDEAVGPADRTRTALQSRLGLPSDYERTEEDVQDRRVRGEN